MFGRTAALEPAPGLASIRALTVAAALLFCGCSLAADVAPDQTEPSPASRAAPPAASRTQVAGTLDHRVKVLSKALNLDPRQEAQLWKILEDQRQAVSKIWTNPAILPAERGPAIRAVQDRTANAIRDILTDEQKKRYNPPKPLSAKSEPPNVEAWMHTQAGHHD